MAESKKKLYKRETINKTLTDLTERITTLKLNEDVNDWLYTIQNVVVFGSYVNSEKDYCHDLDVAIQLKEKDTISPGIINDWNHAHISSSKRSNMSFFELLLAPQEELLKFVKNRSNIISLHDFNNDKDVVLKDKHFYLVKDGELVR